MVEDQRPVLNRHGPLFENIAVCQEKQFTRRFGGGKNAFRFGDFAQLTMVAFQRVGGVDQATDLRGISEEGRQILPVVFPGTDGDRIFVSPFVSELTQLRFCAFAGGGLIHGLQIEHESLAIRPGNILEAVANLVNDAALDLRLLL